MTRRELIAYCLTYSDAYEDYPFDDGPDADGAWAVMRHRKNRRSFAFVFERGGLCINLKCEPLRAEFLRQVYRGISAAYHMNKEHWNTVRVNEDVPKDVLCELIEHSYRLTRPRKATDR